MYCRGLGKIRGTVPISVHAEQHRCSSAWLGHEVSFLDTVDHVAREDALMYLKSASERGCKERDFSKLDTQL